MGALHVPILGGDLPPSGPPPVGGGYGHACSCHARAGLRECKSLDKPDHSWVYAPRAGIGAILIFWALERGKRRGAFLTLSIIHGIGISLVGMVHGSQANQDAGLAVFHFGGAALAIVGGNLVMILIGRVTLHHELPLWLRRACVGLGVLGLVCLVLLVVTAVSGWVYAPVFERASVYPFIAASLLIAGHAFSSRRTEERALQT